MVIRVLTILIALSLRRLQEQPGMFVLRFTQPRQKIPL